jgi:hypothetical protein
MSLKSRRRIFRKHHGQSKKGKRMIPKKPAPDLIRGGHRFSEKIMRKGNWRPDRERSADS